MPRSADTEWIRLDNAAKIFPATSRKRDARVFRISCELFEPIDAAALQDALGGALEQFPNFRCVLKKGLFWYYMEKSALTPTVYEENKPPCGRLYRNGAHTLLFEVTHYKNRINLDMHHVLADGSGALLFLKTIAGRYLMKRHSGIKETDVARLSDASPWQRMADGFDKYYVDEKPGEKTRLTRAYKLRGHRRIDGLTSILYGLMPVQSALGAAHRRGTTLTVLLTAVLIDAIHREMPRSREKRPVVVAVPVDLRKFFPSDTVRNFFGMIHVRYDFKHGPGDFEDILKSADRSFRDELTREKLSGQMYAYSRLERNLSLRLVPLPLKNLALRIASYNRDLNETIILSNLGPIRMPEPFKKHIRLFDVFSSTMDLKLCLCSFEGYLAISFSTAYYETDIQRNFFRSLAEMGIRIEIRTNETQESGFWR